MLNIYFAVISVAVAVIVAVDLALYRYWGFRLDDTILLYLKTPEEAAASITWSDVWPQIIVIAAYTALMVFVYRRLITLYTNDSLTLWRRIGSTLILLFGGGLLFSGHTRRYGHLARKRQQSIFQRPHDPEPCRHEPRILVPLVGSAVR